MAGRLTLGVTAATPLLAYLWHLGFPGIVGLAGLLALGFWLRQPRPPVAVAALAALVAWAVASALWTPFAEGRMIGGRYDDLEGMTWLKLVLQLLLYTPLVLAARALSRRQASTVTSALVVGAFALASVLIIDGAAGTAAYKAFRTLIGDPVEPALAPVNVGQGVFALSLMLWPALATLKRPLLGAVLIASVAGAALMLGVGAPLAALAASGLVYLAVFYGGARVAVGLGWAAAVFVVTAPLLFLAAQSSGLFAWLHPRLETSWAARLDIWSFAARHVFEKPLLGWGLDASRTFGHSILLHPHDMALQVWLELGAIGAVLAAGLWWLLFRAAASVENRTARAGATAAAAAYFVIGALSFGVWQEWWLALGALTAMWAIATDRAAR